MQSNRTTSSRVAGSGTTILLLLLGILLILAALYFCFTQLTPAIEADLDERVVESLEGTGLDAQNILVTGQDVMLMGVVDSESVATDAQQRAGQVYGVARVFNNLRVDKDSGSSSDNSSDTSDVNNQSLNTTATTETDTSPSEAGSELVLEESLSPSTLEISVADGRVTAQGIVPDQETIDRIIAAASGKFGAANVDDDMSTYVGSAKPRWIDGAVALIDQIDNIDNPVIKITQSKATVSGNVSSETMAQQQEALVGKLLGTFLDVESEMTVVAPSEKPINTEALQIKKRPASLKISSSNANNSIISGTLSSEAEAESVRNGMGRLFQGNFTDQLLIDDTVAAAPWIDEALSITNTVQSVQNFSVSINSGQLLLSGDISDRDTGRSLVTTVSELARNKLNVVNNFAPIANIPITLSGEELLAQELQNELTALNTAEIVFTSGSATLTEKAKTVLNQAADIILNYSGQVVEISGHTDSSGDALANLELSRKRAIAVQEYLVDRQVPEARLRAIGYGETDPIADNQTPEGQAANRRIEFNI